MYLRGRGQRFAAIAVTVAMALLTLPVLSLSASASPPTLQPCTATNVKVRTSSLGLSRGQNLEAFTLTNIGSSTCGLDGYPTLTFFTASKLDSRVQVRHQSAVYADVAAKLISVGPGQVVSFGFSYHVENPAPIATTQGCVVQSILIQLPSASSADGSFAYHTVFDACEAGNVVAVTPVEARALPRLTTIS